MCQVANLSHFRSDRLRALLDRPDVKYVGWGNRKLGLSSSPLANPFSHKPNARKSRVRVRSRLDAIEHYRHWLWERIQAQDGFVLAELRQITPATTLVCWCAPKPCHSQVVAKAAAWLHTHEQAICGEATCLGDCWACQTARALDSELPAYGEGDSQYW